jgi:hypothetical protein
MNSEFDELNQLTRVFFLINFFFNIELINQKN